MGRVARSSPMVRIGALGVGAALVASCTAASPDVESADPIGDGAAASPASSSLEWEACEAETSLALPVEFECATLEVPLDHADPGGEQIELALNRVPAGDPDERIGSLVFNPGGPGGSGVEFLQTAALLVPGEVADRFDLVGFDPRGVGASTAIECAVDFDDDVPLLAEGDDAGWDELVAESSTFLDDCTEETMSLAGWVGTNNAAIDLDLVREALGDEQLTYVGFSYGTRLGATYAELFPERVRAVVLDGGVLPTSDLAELDAGQAAGFDLALERFAAACDGDPDCALAELGPTIDVYTELVDELGDAGTLPTGDPDRVLTAGELQLGVVAALYSRDAWPFLARALRDAVDGDGTLLQVLGDGLTGRQPDGTYDNSQAANGFINCADDPARPDTETARADADAAAAQSEYFSDFLRANTACIGIPDALDPLLVGPAEGAAPILVIGTTGDPATPYEWSVALADSLASGVLYTVVGDGHTAYLSIGCVEPVVNAYLIDLEVPPADSSCDGTASGDPFPPAGSSEIELIVALFQCLRDNGADVADIDIADVLADPSGSTIFEGFDPTDPEVANAIVACQDVVGEL